MTHTTQIDRSIDSEIIQTAERNFIAQSYLDRKKQERVDRLMGIVIGLGCLVEYTMLIKILM